eukprot:jgi/Mesen1/4835/ME000243S04009
MTHIRFSDEVLDEVMDVDGADVPVTESKSQPGTYPALFVQKIIQASYGKTDDPDYIFDLASNGDSSVMAASVSTNSVKLYNPHTGAYMGDCQGHTATISDIEFPDAASPNVLLSCAADGTLRVWDIRNKSQVHELRVPGGKQELWSFSVGGPSGHTIAAGANQQIIFWDWRTQRQIAGLEDCHTEAVTQVHFHPSERSKLVSASVDGLVCVFNVSGDITDDDSMEMVLCPGVSVSRIGFCGGSGAAADDNLWCLTHIETLSVWSLRDCEVVGHFPDTRSLASRCWSYPPVDYLIDCDYSLDAGLSLVAGTRDGQVGCFPVHVGDTTVPQDSRKGTLGAPTRVLEGSHTGVVRTMLTQRDNSVSCWTGGEDGKLCGWGTENVVDLSKGRALNFLPLKRTQDLRQKGRHSPY